MKIYVTIFSDDTFRDFFSPSLLREEINATFNATIFSLNKEEPTYEARKKYLKEKEKKSWMLLIALRKAKQLKKKESFKM